jgi:hypothetical protein
MNATLRRQDAQVEAGACIFKMHTQGVRRVTACILEQEREIYPFFPIRNQDAHPYRPPVHLSAPIGPFGGACAKMRASFPACVLSVHLGQRDAERRLAHSHRHASVSADDQPTKATPLGAGGLLTARRLKGSHRAALACDADGATRATGDCRKVLHAPPPLEGGLGSFGKSHAQAPTASIHAFEPVRQ